MVDKLFVPKTLTAVGPTVQWTVKHDERCYMRCQQFLNVEWFEQTFEDHILVAAKSKHCRN